MKRTQRLKDLLTRDLPLDRAGPALKRAVRHALASGREPVLVAACGAVVRDLLRQGVLARVSLEGKGSQNSSYVMKRGSRELLDLSALYQPVEPTRGPGENENHLGPDQDASLQQVVGFLGAMEEAQNLRLADVQSGEITVILGHILQLLADFTPQFHLGLLLNQMPGEDPQVPGIVFADQADGKTGWLTLRDPGHSVWIPLADELPRGLAATLSAGDSLGKEPVAVAVPIWDPGDKETVPAERREAGLLFVMAPGSWGRDPLLKIGGRLSRFVTNRWRHQRDVNLIIHTDALTGAYNRAFFNKHFTLEIERARRSESALTLVLLDLDHFKRINDTYGHYAGDRILQMVARRLKEQLRRIDHVCRIGGEEFALILPDTTPEAAHEVMARLLHTQFREEVPVDGKLVPIGVTLSFGVVNFPADGVDPLELFNKADAVLYLSKDQGRNRCNFWGSEGQHLEIDPTQDQPDPS